MQITSEECISLKSVLSVFENKKRKWIYVKKYNLLRICFPNLSAYAESFQFTFSHKSQTSFFSPFPTPKLIRSSIVSPSILHRNDGPSMEHRWSIDGVSTEEEGRMRGLGTELQKRYNVLKSETKGQKNHEQLSRKTH